MPTRWNVLTDDAVFTAPKGAACYAIYLDGLLTYVGSTENLRVRVGNHVKIPRYSALFDTPWGRARCVTVKFRPSRKYGDWVMHELRLIRRLQPTGNTRGIVRKAALNG